VRVTALRDYLYADLGRYPEEAMRLTFTSNHDENSWSGSEFVRFGNAREAMTVFTFVVPRGLPLIYTGQEVGYDHSFAFFDRDSIPAECYKANGVTELYRRLAALRHDNPALASGGRGGRLVEIRNNAEDCLMLLVRHSCRLPDGNLYGNLYRCNDGRGTVVARTRRGGYGTLELSGAHSTVAGYDSEVVYMRFCGLRRCVRFSGFGRNVSSRRGAQCAASRPEPVCEQSRRHTFGGCCQPH